MTEEMEEFEELEEGEKEPEAEPDPQEKIFETMENRFKELSEKNDEKFSAMMEQFTGALKELLPKEPEKPKTYGLDEKNYEKNKPTLDLFERVVAENIPEVPNFNSLADMINNSVTSAFAKFNNTDPELAAYLEQRNPVTGRPIKQDYEQAMNDGDTATLQNIVTNARKLARKHDKGTFSSVQTTGADPPKVMDAKEKLQKLQKQYLNLRDQKEADLITADECTKKGKEIHAQVNSLREVLEER